MAKTGFHGQDAMGQDLRQGLEGQWRRHLRSRMLLGSTLFPWDLSEKTQLGREAHWNLQLGIVIIIITFYHYHYKDLEYYFIIYIYMYSVYIYYTLVITATISYVRVTNYRFDVYFRWNMRDSR